MRAVILAAGDGGRLNHLTSALPKPLIPLAGRPIIEYTLEALAEAGVTDVIVVTGYRETQVRHALGGMNLAFVSNPRYHESASLSLRAARAATHGEPFLLLMADHMLSRPIIHALLESHEARPGASFVAADFASRDAGYTAEATKLAIDGDAVTAIGKALDDWRALDAGAFLLAPGAWDAVDAVDEDCELSVIFGELARRRSLHAADISGAFWYDIDTAEDLANAAAMLSTVGA
jgi:choline kinase